MSKPRQRFLDYVRRVPGARSIVSPFLPKPELISRTLEHMGLPVTHDYIKDEIRLSQELDYEPMFMTDCSGLMFPWEEDKNLSNNDWTISIIPTPHGEWIRCISRQVGLYGDESGFPVRTESDHEKLVSVCERIGDRASAIRRYFHDFRRQVGDNGVIVIGHPHVTWLGCQISQKNMIYHAVDYPEAYERSMEAICEAATFIFGIAMDEGIDFMSESGYGLEMISPKQFEDQDLRYSRILADWTHHSGGLFWYHNCGKTRELMRSGQFNLLGADVIETIAPSPEGDNELAESRKYLDDSISSKGNLSLGLLRDGSVEEIIYVTKRMVHAVCGYQHIHSTADSVFAETPVENFMAFLQTAREEAEKG